MKQSVRIIGGKYRRKKICFPAILGLRPTPDRVKETLFNWLMHDIQAAHCIDAFAGSGALGFEAFSRGAAKVTLIESATQAVNYLQQTINEFNAPNLTLIKADARLFLKKLTTPVDIIFLDPPFASNYLSECLEIIAKGSCLRPGGLVYLESAQQIIPEQLYWLERKAGKTGQLYYALYEKRT